MSSLVCQFPKWCHTRLCFLSYVGLACDVPLLVTLANAGRRSLYQGDLHRITPPVCHPDDLWSVTPNLSSTEKQVVKPFTSENFPLTPNLDKLDLLAMSTGYIETPGV